MLPLVGADDPVHRMAIGEFEASQQLYSTFDKAEIQTGRNNFEVPLERDLKALIFLH